ncbi:MAG: hypothetical protein ACXABG_03705 [Promethearchaeota archaeon]|jgi:hypothetical protein
MKSNFDWSKYLQLEPDKVKILTLAFDVKNVFAMGLMPVRGPKGFRKLDYEFAAKQLNVVEIMDKLEKHHFNVFGLVIKDTDGACVWNTKVGWNPIGRDILGEFCDAGKDRDIKIMVSFTSMNDAYQGIKHPERVSVHGKTGKKSGIKYNKGDISTHEEGEMRIDLPEGILLEEYLEKIPFLTDKYDIEKGKSRGSRGKGLIPTTSFMCPNSKHVDYLLDLTQEVIKNYPVSGFFADYIRYDGAFTDLCCCNRCRTKFSKNYGTKAKTLKSHEWYEFKSDTIAEYARKLQEVIKRTNNDCTSGWFCLPGPKKMLSLKRLGQDWTKLSSILDVASPMEYPYLMGTRDDGWYWRKLADLFYWYFMRNMKKRIHEFKSPVLAVTNSVECNAEEMLKQMRGFNFGSGIAVFKYFGTTDDQWNVLRDYAEKELDLVN